MKRCKCGKEIDDRWDLCYECNEKSKSSTTDARTESIQRQVAAKCAAQELAGRLPEDKGRADVFNAYLKLIRG